MAKHEARQRHEAIGAAVARHKRASGSLAAALVLGEKVESGVLVDLIEGQRKRVGGRAAASAQEDVLGEQADGMSVHRDTLRAALAEQNAAQEAMYESVMANMSQVLKQGMQVGTVILSTRLHSPARVEFRVR